MDDRNLFSVSRDLKLPVQRDGCPIRHRFYCTGNFLIKNWGKKERGEEKGEEKRKEKKEKKERKEKKRKKEEERKRRKKKGKKRGGGEKKKRKKGEKRDVQVCNNRYYII